MSHKVHPKAFRIRETKDWVSRWIGKKDYASFLKEDFVIRSFLEKKLREASIDNVEIERFAKRIHIIISSGRPGLIIGRGGSGIEELKKALEKLLSTKEKKEIKLEIREIKNPRESANLIAQSIAQQLEKRMPVRRVLKQSITKAQANKTIEGIRVTVSGRLGGAEIARRESLKAGRLPLQTLRANIEYGFAEAYTTYGTIGVKVWLYKGENFE